VISRSYTNRTNGLKDCQQAWYALGDDYDNLGSTLPCQLWGPPNDSNL
jgi:hypothetical protein